VSVVDVGLLPPPSDREGRDLPAVRPVACALRAAAADHPLVLSRGSSSDRYAADAERSACAFAHEQPSVGVDAHDCFARRNVAELTIELATRRSCGSVGAGSSMTIALTQLCRRCADADRPSPIARGHSHVAST
jgi:hypothetical protein